jgi:hypothetical protein
MIELLPARTQFPNEAVLPHACVYVQVWEEGAAAGSLAVRKAAIDAQREEVEAARKALRKKLAPPPSAARAAAGGEASRPTPPEGGYMDGLEFVTLDEICKVHAMVATCVWPGVQWNRWLL